MSNKAVIVDQFTRQAVPFASKPEHTQAQAAQVVLEALALRPTDQLLDVACGPGLTACEFASRVHRVTGVDLTPAMIRQAKKRAADLGVVNASWNVADVTALPYADGAFSVVFSRYAFHHFPQPGRVLSEMTRVCADGGRVVVADVYSTNSQQQALYDHIERLRDPSHTSSLQLDHFRSLFDAAGLIRGQELFYRLSMDVDSLLASSFPEPGNGQTVRELIDADLGKNLSGFEPVEADGKLVISFPIVVLTATTRRG